jgi:hypothetical protein
MCSQLVDVVLHDGAISPRVATEIDVARMKREL